MSDWSKYGSSGGGSGGSDWSKYGSSGGGWVSTGGGGGGGGGIFGGIENFIGSHGGHTVGGLVSNLGSDAYHTVTDLPAGLNAVGSQLWWEASHPHPLLGGSKSINDELHNPHGFYSKSVRPYVANERHIYGAALHGNFHPLYEHPLTPILDLATIATGGGAAALKVGRLGALGSRAAEIANSDRVLQLEGLGERLNQSRTLQGRVRQRMFDTYSMAHQDAPIVGSASRLNRISMSRAYRQSLRDMIPVGKYRQLIHPLTRDERTALHIAAEGVPLDERLSFYKSLPQTRTIKRYAASIDKPGVREALANPSENLVKAVNGARDIEDIASQRLIETGQLTPEIRAERALLPQRIMRDAEVTTENAVHPAFGSPFRLPHIDAEAKSGLYTAPKAAPLGKAKELGVLKKNTGARLRAGAVATDPETFVRDLLQTQRHEHLLTMQRNVLDKVAKPLSTDSFDEHGNPVFGGKLANEHYYRPSYNRKSTTPIPRSIREEEALARDLETEPQRAAGLEHTAKESVFTEKNAPADVREAVLSGDIERLNQLGVQRVPSAFGKRFTSNFAGTHPAMRFFFDRPLDVWRALTLNLRPAWMVNNLVGNNLMYFLRHPGGAGEYLQTLLRTERGEDKVRQLWKWTIKHPTIRRKYESLFNEIAPEIHSSGLYATQTRVTNPGVYQSILDRSATVRAAKKLGLAAKAVSSPLRAFGRGVTFFERHIAEDAPREAAMLRELKPLVGKFKKAGMSTEQALKSLDPRDVELAVDRVNDALGDFNSLSATERRVVRRFIPFWSWYRVIVTVSGKFAARYPGRVLLLHAIAQQAKDEDKNLPSWLKGEIQLGPVKGGVQPVLTTAGINPYQTLPQVATENPASLLNPFIGAGIAGVSNVDPFTGNTYQGYGANSGFNPADVGRRTAGAFFSGLAPTRLGLQLTGNAHNSKIYAPKTYGHAGPVPINDALLQYLGLPIRHVRVRQAKEDQRKGY